MREEGGVEVEAEAMLFGPVDPGGEMLGGELVAVDFATGVIGVDGVEVETVAARNEAERLVEVGAELINVAGLARIITSRLNSAAGQAGSDFEACDVVALPAVQRDSDSAQLLHGPLGGNTKLRIALAGHFIRLLDDATAVHVVKVYQFP